MSLDAILLGVLKTPHSGYDLKKEFEAGLAHFWSVNLSQIYQALKKLEAKGFVSSQSGKPSLGPARIIYTRTAKGQMELIQWLRSGPIRKAERLHHIAQTYFLHELESGEKASEFFRTLLSDLELWQSKMNAINSMWRGEHDESFFELLPEEGFYPYLTLDLGLRKNKAMIEWCQDCLMRIEKRSKN